MAATPDCVDIVIVKTLYQRLSRIWTRLLRGSSNSDSDSPLQPEFHRAKIDDERLEILVESFHDVDPYPGFSKYLDADHYITTALHHYSVAELTHTDPESVLDIGTGAGYFPFVCQNLGHETMCLDVPAHPFYDEMAQLLELTRVERRVEPFQKLP